MVETAQPDSASALPGGRLLSMRSESYHPGRRATRHVVTHRHKMLDVAALIAETGITISTSVVPN